MIAVEFEYKVNPKIEKEVEKNISDILYSMARQCLDMTYPITPRNTGKMANSSMAHGVEDISNTDKMIGSFTDYASSVWNKNAQKTHWTTPGTTSRWFAETMKIKGNIILANATNKEKL